MADFIMTIEDDGDLDNSKMEEDNSDEDDLEDDFKFENTEKAQLPWDFAPTIEKMKKQMRTSSGTSLDEKIQSRISLKKDSKSTGKDSDSIEVEDTITEQSNSDRVKVIEKKKKQKKIIKDDIPTFEELHLSRPLLKAIEKLGYSDPTPIQAKTIPLALNGKDILASAQTGSGKTAAFLLPILERLLYRDVEYRAIRVLVLLPTRELALQCQSVLEKLSQFTNITSCLVVGGLNTKAQEVELRKSPDVVIATPGRLIDHILNSLGIGLEDLEILILDEADRLLDMGFRDSIQKIVDSCPTNRQTLLFSATLNDEVKTLAKLSLKQPIRVQVDAMFQVASTLDQEFVKIKDNQQVDRPAILLSLCTRVFNGGGSIIFVKSKKEAHNLRIIFGLSGLKAAELHGNLTQEQRFESLQQFRDGTVDFLLATDIASRGLDIIGVKSVINYNMPLQIAQYIHRVGRTARAGAEGRSCSFVIESDRKVLKEIVSKARNKAKSRSVSQESINEWRAKIETMTNDIRSIIKEELKEKDVRKAEEMLDKAEKKLKQDDHITQEQLHRERNWFMTPLETKTKDELSRIESGVFDPTKKGDKEKSPTALNKIVKKNLDPYYGLSRKQRRRKQMKEEMEREMREDEKQNGESMEDEETLVKKFNAKFKKTQTQQRTSAKSSKRNEALRRSGIYTGPTDQEKQKIQKTKDKRQKKSNLGNVRKQAVSSKRKK